MSYLPGAKLQNDLNEIVKWSVKISLEINGSKCKAIHFGNNNPLITYCISETDVLNINSFRDLGLIVNSDMRFRHNVCSIVKTKFLKLINYLFKTFHSSLPSLYMRFYLSYIIPIIDYSVIFYVGSLKSSLTIVEFIKYVFTCRLFIRCYRSHSIP